MQLLLFAFTGEFVTCFFLSRCVSLMILSLLLFPLCVYGCVSDSVVIFFFFRVWEWILVPILKLKRRKVCDEWQKNRKLHHRLRSHFVFLFHSESVYSQEGNPAFIQSRH
uniref:Putative secreted protein n=1 Tax=Ixodes ricinus TaxID=34613 RepID=A0A6B0UJ60_IXORI